ncbi:hypothetical protein, partial [Rhizobium sp. C4]|uniref:hypothetical protein n=1 Tax=Rhizobium sp. C4 TaxID=1349800 RepID=UPI001E40CBCA
GIRKNGGLAFHDPSPIAGEGWPSSPALLYLTKKPENHKTSTSTLLGVISAGFEVDGAFLWFEQRDYMADRIP